MAKGGREKIKLESTAGTGHFYTTSKNKRTTPKKLEFNQYDQIIHAALDGQGVGLGIGPLVQRHIKGIREGAAND